MAAQVRPAPAASPDREIRVSVIVPTHNRSRLLRDVVGALWAQTLDPRSFEVIIVDNCSEDDTADVMKELQAGSPCCLRYHVMPENRGPARSRNTGARLAEGSILAFTDDDCRPSPQWLERGIAAFNDPSVAFVTGPIGYKPEQVGTTGFFARDGRDIAEEHPTYSWTNILYRRDVFLEAKGSDEALCLPDFRNRVVDCGDTDLAWRIKEAGYRSAFAREALVWHELEDMKALDWIWEPFRLFVVASLIRRHPGLRWQLLQGGVFFTWANALFYLAVLGLLLGIAVRGSLALLALPYLAWALWLLRAHLSLQRIPKLAAQVALLAARQSTLCAGMIYGSIRFRSLVL